MFFSFIGWDYCSALLHDKEDWWRERITNKKIETLKTLKRKWRPKSTKPLKLEEPESNQIKSLPEQTQKDKTWTGVQEKAPQIEFNLRRGEIVAML